MTSMEMGRLPSLSLRGSWPEQVQNFSEDPIFPYIHIYLGKLGKKDIEQMIEKVDVDGDGLVEF